MAALTPPARPCCVMSRPGPAAPAGASGAGGARRYGGSPSSPVPSRPIPSRPAAAARLSPSPLQARRDSCSKRAGEDGDEVCSPQAPHEPAQGESSSQRSEILGPCVGVGRDQPRGCGQGMSPAPSLGCRRNFGSYETTAKTSPAPKGQEVELEFKNQPGRLKRVSKLQTCKAAFSRLDPAQCFVFLS